MPRMSLVIGPVLAPLPTPALGPVNAAAAEADEEGRAPGRARAGLGARPVRLDLAALTATQTAGEPPSQAPNPEEQRAIDELKARDREVRRHETAHARAGGEYAGTPHYNTVRGPDGRSYAVGGTTPIDVSPVAGNPEATIEKMQTVKRAALAPAEPSDQDRAIAGRAEAEEAKARNELRQQKAAEDGTGAAGGGVSPQTAAGSIVNLFA